MWLKELQIAIIEKNTDNLNKVLMSAPNLEKKEDIEKALYLLKEASILLHALKDDTARTMKKIKENIKFLKVTEAKKPSKFDIKS